VIVPALRTLLPAALRLLGSLLPCAFLRRLSKIDGATHTWGSFAYMAGLGVVVSGATGCEDDDDGAAAGVVGFSRWFSIVAIPSILGLKNAKTAVGYTTWRNPD